jgi:hypothetical protein
MAIDFITDHLERAQGRLTSKFRDSAHFIGLVTMIAAEVQEIENAFQGLVSQLRTPANAAGATLDLIGRLVQAPSRGTKTDAEYRAWIAAQIIVNRSFGPSADLRGLVAAFLPTWATIHICENDDPALLSAFKTQPAPCTPVIEAGISDPPITEQQAHDLMLFVFDAKAAGTRPLLGFAITAPTGLFQFDQSAGSHNLDHGNFYNLIDRP